MCKKVDANGVWVFITIKHRLAHGRTLMASGTSDKDSRMLGMDVIKCSSVVVISW